MNVEQSNYTIAKLLLSLTAEIYNGTRTLLQEKCHNLDFTSTDCSILLTDSQIFEGETLAVQNIWIQHTNAQGDVLFDSQSCILQIVVNFMTSLSYCSQTTTISIRLQSIIQTTSRVRLRMEHDNFSYFIWLKSLQSI